MSFQNELNELNNLENVSVDATAHIHDGRGAQNVFCAGWPTAKNVLESILAMTKNPAVKVLVRTILALGEGYYTKHCQGA